MSEEEKKIIESLKEVLDIRSCKISDDIQDSEIKTTLNLIEKQQKEIELKDEVIDEMSTYMDVAFSSAQLSRLLKQEILPLEIYKHDIKQYFLDKVKGNKND